MYGVQAQTSIQVLLASTLASVVPTNIFKIVIFFFSIQCLLSVFIAESFEESAKLISCH